MLAAGASSRKGCGPRFTAPTARAIGARLLAAVVLACACSPPGERSAPSVAPGPVDGPVDLEARFDEARAFGDLRDLVAIGPRPAGSSGAQAARELIGERLRQAGWRVEERPFRARVPGGAEIAMVNVIGVLPGRPAETQPGRILLVTHYDTKSLPGKRFVGANDGASGAAVLLELARQLALSERPHETWLVFFDGEEAIGRTINAQDGLYGSRELAARMQDDGSLASIRALLLVDMVGDADLDLVDDVSAAPWLRRILREEATRVGVEIARSMPGLLDDHTPFVERGVEAALPLIDFQFGARVTPGPFWHSERDDLAAVSAASLNRVGSLAVLVLERIELALAAGRPE
jgi:hypothetical protein